MEIVAGNYRLKLTADNPFIVVLSHRANTIESVHHLPVDVIRSESAYYVPMINFLPLFHKVWHRSITFDTERPELVISRRCEKKPRLAILGTNEQKQGPEKTSGRSKGSDRLAPRQAVADVPRSFDITHLSVDTRKNGSLVRIHSKKSLKGYTAVLDDLGSVTVNIPNATVDANELRQTPVGGDDVIGISAVQAGPNAQIRLDVDPVITTRKLVRDGSGNDLLLTLFRKAEVQKIYSAEQQGKSGDGKDRSKWALDCIVIDPGHGGKDPGAIGVTGIKEKNITLGIALKLGNLIEKNMKGVKVVFTRKNDRFVELDKRGKMANQAAGKLFISLHCNSTEKKPSSANGFEVYLLRPGRTEEAVRIAEFENSVIKLEKDYKKRYAKLTNENFILMTMAQSAYAKYSEQFAEQLVKEVRKYKKIRSRDVRQAGFYVLVGASMPNVLIEAGFISNAKEEAFLASRYGQQHIANRIYQAVKVYAEIYRKSLKD